MDPANQPIIPDRRRKEWKHLPPETYEQKRAKHRVYEDRYRAKHKDEISERWSTPEFRAKRRAEYAANGDAIREYSNARIKRYRRDNPEWTERQNRLARERYEAKKQDPEWRANHRARQRAYEARRMTDPDIRQRKREQGKRSWHNRFENNPEFRENSRTIHRERHRSRYRDTLNPLLEAQGWYCGDLSKGGGWKGCGSSLRNVPQSDMHVDHILPVSRGGGSEPSNLQVLCARCNIQANDKLKPAGLSDVSVSLVFN